MSHHLPRCYQPVTSHIKDDAVTTETGETVKAVKWVQPSDREVEPFAQAIARFRAANPPAYTPPPLDADHVYLDSVAMPASPEELP